jgi:hypothetical protein
MKQINLVAILVAATIIVSTRVVASTRTRQMAMATKNKGQDTNGSNAKGPIAHGGSGGIAGTGGSGGVGENGGVNVISGGGSGDCQICG